MIGPLMLTLDKPLKRAVDVPASEGKEGRARLHINLQHHSGLAEIWASLNYARTVVNLGKDDSTHTCTNTNTNTTTVERTPFSGAVRNEGKSKVCRAQDFGLNARHV